VPLVIRPAIRTAAELLPVSSAADPRSNAKRAAAVVMIVVTVACNWVFNASVQISMLVVARE